MNITTKNTIANTLWKSHSADDEQQEGSMDDSEENTVMDINYGNEESDEGKESMDSSESDQDGMDMIPTSVFDPKNKTKGKGGRKVRFATNTTTDFARIQSEESTSNNFVNEDNVSMKWNVYMNDLQSYAKNQKKIYKSHSMSKRKPLKLKVMDKDEKEWMEFANNITKLLDNKSQLKQSRNKDNNDNLLKSEWNLFVQNIQKSINNKDFWSYEELKSDNALKCVENKEQYLSDDEFEKIFTITKETFNSAQPWKQKSLRIAKGLNK